MTPFENDSGSGRESSFHEQLMERTNELYRRSFAEIYIEGGAKPVTEEAIPQRSGPAARSVPETDPIRKRFIEMRYLASMVRLKNNDYDRIRASSFFRQAKFMEEFEDDYTGDAAFSMYFPEYQMMSYEQLRTYFSWRTKVRRGIVEKTSTSYVFIYLYELLNGIGTKNPGEGLRRLLYIWGQYRGFEKKLDQYLAGWVKDYYVLNDFSVPFSSLVAESELLSKFYPSAGTPDYFTLYAPLSDYKWAKSSFCSEETDQLVRGCFQAVMEAVTALFIEAGADFDDMLFFGSRENLWVPFQRGIYYNRPGPRTEKRTIKLSPTEVYRYENGHWVSSLNRVCRTQGHRILGYLLRRIEQFLRRAEKFKHPLGASRDKLDAEELSRGGVGPEAFFACVDQAITAYYRETKRKNVTVDPQALERIRASALVTQEKLLVNPEEDAFPGDEGTPMASYVEKPAVFAAPVLSPPPASSNSPWERLDLMLDGTERSALKLLLQGASLQEFTAFARARQTMPEVLADNINQKAMETVGDSLFELSDTVTVFSEYTGELERVIDESDKSAQTDHQYDH